MQTAMRMQTARTKRRSRFRQMWQLDPGHELLERHPNGYRRCILDALAECVETTVASSPHHGKDLCNCNRVTLACGHQLDEDCAMQACIVAALDHGRLKCRACKKMTVLSAKAMQAMRAAIKFHFAYASLSTADRPITTSSSL